jgi:hypothetical protein
MHGICDGADWRSLLAQKLVNPANGSRVANVAYPILSQTSPSYADRNKLLLSAILMPFCSASQA